MREVLTHAWPGNIRELENVIERAVLLAPDNGVVEVVHLFGEPSSARKRMADVSVPGGGVAEMNPDTLNPAVRDVLSHQIDLESLERRLTQMAMQRANGNLSKAARLLGITRPQLAYRLKREGIPVS